jgi:hypothetical protein
METTEGEPITTDALLERLAAVGLHVTRNMLAQDVRAGYLPKLGMTPRGPRGGIGRSWAPWAARRAIYLYRLRQRGAQGDLLRVLLFLQDGWGWEGVKPICLAGLGKVIGMQASPVRRRLRRVTPTGLDFLGDEFAEGVFQSPAVARFVWGMGLFGQPLPGGSLLPFSAAFRTTLGADISDEQDRAAERLVAGSGLTWDRAVVLVEAADAAQADAARRQLLGWTRWFRGVYHAYLAQRGIHGQSSNPLTLFGCPPAQLRALCRSLPGRPTPAQLLATLLVPFLALEGMRRAGELPEELEAVTPP